MSEFHGPLSHDWYDCFPVDRVADVLAYVASSWADLSARFPLKHHARETEPNLTKSLSDHLDDSVRRRQAGVGGQFHSERSIGKRNSVGRLKQIGRTDIEYHLPRDGRAVLILEFKKLKGSSSWRQAYRDKGMLKFIRGPYATKETVGMMCGLVSSDLAIEIAAVRASIERGHLKLACVANVAGSHTSEPSQLAPGVVAFDTEHIRPPILAEGPIKLGHLFLIIAAEDPAN